MERDFRVLVDRLGRWYLIISTNRNLADDRDAPTSKHSVISGDPGVRSQFTWYDEYNF